MHTQDVAEANIEKIGQLFPNCLTERINENGKPEMAIDFDKLKQELSKEVVEGNQERYQFTWPGKREAMRLANTPSNMTLRPDRESSVDFDNTENLYIEGDNLEVLKLLRENYLGKVKMIYIDPPYNTGSDFVYEDDFSETSGEFKDRSGMFDESGNMLLDKYTINSESNGRFHTDWLNLIYSRIKVARDLLSPDGLIFISIDDCEVASLKTLLNEIMGEDNFVSQIVIETGEVYGAKAAHVNKTLVKVKDYILCYRKSAIQNSTASDNRVPLCDSSKEKFDPHFNTYIDGSLSPCKLSDFIHNDNLISQAFKKYKIPATVQNLSTLMDIDSDVEKHIYSISDKIFTNQPYTGKIDDEDCSYLDNHPILQKNNLLLFKTSSGSIRYYQSYKETLRISDDYIPKYTRTSYRGDLWKGFHIDMRNIDDEGGILFNSGKKPVRLVKQLIKWTNLEKGSIVLDFFSGSATTAHAVMSINSEEKTGLKYILVQIPEIINKKNSKEYDGLETICDIGLRRIALSAEELKRRSGIFSNEIDYGVRVLKLASTNMKDVYYKPEEFSETSLFEDNVKPDRTPEDLLFQVMLECNLPLSAKIDRKTIAGKEVFNVNEGYLLACFDEDVNETVITEVAKQKPYYFIMRDKSLSSDNVADNFEQIFNAYSKDTIRKIL